MPALIPADYMPDVHLRLVLYKRIAAAADAEALDELAAEMIDRFGPLAPPTENLYRVTRLSSAASALGLKRLDVGPQGGPVDFGTEHRVEPATVMRLVQTRVPRVPARGSAEAADQPPAAEGARALRLRRRAFEASRTEAVECRMHTFRIPFLGLLAAVALAALPGSRTAAEQPAANAPAAALEAAPAPAPGGPPVATEGPVYNIELVIFRSTSAPTGEDFSAEPPLRGGSGTDVDGGGGSRAGRFVREIPASQFQLNDVEARLRAAAGYQPIAHVAWSQTASAFGTRAGFTLQRLGVTAPGLGGLVFLERGQFLHLGMALSYTPAPPAGDTPSYRLSEIRRIRFYERTTTTTPPSG